MARKRMIDPGFWIDEKLGTIPATARLLFMGLISNADDDGRLPGHPALIKSQIFPYDIDISHEQVEEWMKLLKELDIIQIYSVSNQTYIQINNFSKHQTISRPTPSKYPSPKESNDNSLSTHGVVIEDSIPKEKKRKEIEVEEKIKENMCVDAPAENSSNSDEGAQDDSSGKGEYTTDFEKFWSYYPRTKEKKAAYKAWNTRLKDRASPKDLISASCNYAEECRLKGTQVQYIKLAKTFLGPSKPYEEYIKGLPEPIQDKKMPANIQKALELVEKAELEEAQGGISIW